jgi:predicted acyl esterase
MGLAWLRRDPASGEGWTCHQPPRALLRQPLLLIGGWHDPYLNGLLDLWRQAEAAGGQPLLRIGPWTHLDWAAALIGCSWLFLIATSSRLAALGRPLVKPNPNPKPNSQARAPA